MKKKTVKKLNKKTNQKAGKRVLAHLVALSQQMPSNLILHKAKIIKAKTKNNQRLSLLVKMDWSQHDNPMMETIELLHHDDNQTETISEISSEAPQQANESDAENHAACNTLTLSENTETAANDTALQEAMLEIEYLKQQLNLKNRDLDDLLYDSTHEIRKKDHEIEELKQKLQHFNALSYQQENISKNKKINSETALLQYGQECDLYDGEILSFTRKVLEYALKNQTHDKSRQQHILQDLLHANPLPHDLRTEKEKMLDQTMKTYSRMDNATRQKLEEIGFSISENGAHYKLLFMNDTRYTATAPKSGSDHKGGKNFARDVGNILF